MNPLLLRLAAIESRIALNRCSCGTSGRVHSLRLRRCFRSTPRRAADDALEQTSLSQSGDHNEFAMGTLAWLGQDSPFVMEGGKEVVEYKRRQSSQFALEHLRQLPRHGHPRYLRIREDIVPGHVLPFPLELPAKGLVLQEEVETYKALRTGNPHEVMRSLMNLVQLESHGYPSALLVSAPPPTFSEILRCIDPKHFIDPYSAVFREISSVSTSRLGAKNVLGQEDYYEFCSAFLAQAGRLMNARRQRWPFSVSDYKYLLKCAKAVGHAKAAESIWKTMTTPPKAGEGEPVIPDAEAFNHFLAVKCWQDRMNPKHRQRLRVIEENFSPRSWLIPPHSLTGHRVRTPGGIKSVASRLFRQMVELGVTGNEETFCLMMIALGREGELNGIASILKRVWNIDVDAVMTKEDSEIPTPTPYGPRSPFFPSNYLLYTIAHAYGSNNDISTALRLLDYVSRSYATEIPLNVWSELLRWTYVVSMKKKLVRKKAGIEKLTGREAGQLPPQAVSSLWETMTSAPYHVQPTMQMYDRLMTNLLHRHRFGEMQIRMEEALSVLKDEIRVLGKKEAVYIAVRRRNKESLVREKAQDLIYARFRVWRNRQYVKRWVRLLIHHGSKSLETIDQWSAQNMPNIVSKWTLFLPNPVPYRTPTGVVSFWSGTHSLKKWRAGMLGRRARRQAKYIAQWNEAEEFYDKENFGVDEREPS